MHGRYKPNDRFQLGMGAITPASLPQPAARICHLEHWQLDAGHRRNVVDDGADYFAVSHCPDADGGKPAGAVVRLLSGAGLVLTACLMAENSSSFRMADIATKITRSGAKEIQIFNTETRSREAAKPASQGGHLLLHSVCLWHDSPRDKETGERLFKSRQYGEAIPLLKSAADAFPQDEGLWQELVMAARDYGQHEQAVEFAKLAIRHHPRADWRNVNHRLVSSETGLLPAEYTLPTSCLILVYTEQFCQEQPERE
jgi:Tetratricopeptide repeat